MIVMAMITAATTQPAAIQKPPKTIQSTFRRMETGGMSLIFGDFFGPEWRAVAPCDGSTIYKTSAAEAIVAGRGIGQGRLAGFPAEPPCTGSAAIDAAAGIDRTAFLQRSACRIDARLAQAPRRRRQL